MTLPLQKVSLVGTRLLVEHASANMLAQGTLYWGTICIPLVTQGHSDWIGFTHPSTGVQICISVPTPEKFHQRLRYEFDYLANKDGGKLR